jgi:hypothetical protein
VATRAVPRRSWVLYLDAPLGTEHVAQSFATVYLNPRGDCGYRPGRTGESTHPDACSRIRVRLRTKARRLTGASAKLFS